VSKPPNGPSAKFFVHNVSTLDELRLTGNCLEGSQPLLSFDEEFDSKPHFQLIKELFLQAFGTPKGHPKSKPFIDHVFNFSIADQRIWFRNFQIVDDEISRKKSDVKLVEIGPRFVLQPVRIFSGSFYGETLYHHVDFISPNKFRSLKRKYSNDYALRVQAKKKTKYLQARPNAKLNDFSEVFD